MYYCNQKNNANRWRQLYQNNPPAYLLVQVWLLTKVYNIIGNNNLKRNLNSQ